MNTIRRCLLPFAWVIAVMAGAPGRAEPPKVDRDANGKVIDHCR